MSHKNSNVNKGAALAGAPAVEPTAPIVPAVEPTALKSFSVAKGKAVTTRRGILSNGDVVQERDFMNVESFLYHCDSGTVVES